MKNTKMKELRDVMGLTQHELGLAIGYSESTATQMISDIELGKRHLTQDRLIKMADVLCCTTDEILESSKEEYDFTGFEALFGRLNETREVKEKRRKKFIKFMDEIKENSGEWFNCQYGIEYVAYLSVQEFETREVGAIYEVRWNK